MQTSLPPEVVLADCRAISSGTLAVLTGERSYAALDRIHTAWILWLVEQPASFATWVEAWNAYQARRK